MFLMRFYDSFKDINLEQILLKFIFKKEVYNITIFLREMRNVKTIINNIIRICDWENAEIRYEVDNMFSSYHRIQRYVKEKARKVKEVSCI